MSIVTGTLEKLMTKLDSPVQYFLSLDNELTPLNALLGKPITLHFQQIINCIACARKTANSFGQGYCFVCFQKLARCDQCIVRPELCHFHQGTCREPEWGLSHCMQPHIIYLANSSGLKVGITRESQIPTRWIDQGAVAALPILKVDSRYHSGLLEVILKRFVADKTNWRVMLKGTQAPLDLSEEKEKLLALCKEELDQFRKSYGTNSLTIIEDNSETRLTYPVMSYPEKITSINVLKTPLIQSRLLGIKGQYLILEQGVMNIRNLSGHCVQFEA